MSAETVHVHAGVEDGRPPAAEAAAAGSAMALKASSFGRAGFSRASADLLGLFDVDSNSIASCSVVELSCDEVELEIAGDIVGGLWER